MANQKRYLVSHSGENNSKAQLKQLPILKREVSVLSENTVTPGADPAFGWGGVELWKSWNGVGKAEDIAGEDCEIGLNLSQRLPRKVVHVG